MGITSIQPLRFSSPPMKKRPWQELRLSKLGNCKGLDCSTLMGKKKEFSLPVAQAGRRFPAVLLLKRKPCHVLASVSLLMDSRAAILGWKSTKGKGQCQHLALSNPISHSEKTALRMVSLSGGSRDNVIPSQARADIWVESGGSSCNRRDGSKSYKQNFRPAILACLYRSNRSNWMQSTPRI